MTTRHLFDNARSKESGAAMMFAILIILILAASMSVAAAFIVTDVRHERDAVDNAKQTTSSDGAFSEALLTINRGDINAYVGAANTQTSSDGLSKWYLTKDTNGTYSVIVKNLKSTKDSSRKLSSRPVSYVYPNTHNAGNDHTILYEPTLHGYFQWAFYGMRTPDAATPDPQIFGSSSWKQTLTNSTIMSYAYNSTTKSTSEGPTPAKSSGQGVWATSVLPGAVNDNYSQSVKNTESLSNVSADAQKFLGAADGAIKEGSDGYRPDSNCGVSCQLGTRQNYAYDLSFDQLENYAVNKCEGRSGTWRSSTAPTPGVLSTSQNDGCWDTMIFDRNTVIEPSAKPIVAAKDIRVDSGVTVNYAGNPRNIYLINYGSGGLTMLSGSSINGLVTSMGQKSCKLTGSLTSKVKVYGSLNCLNAYFINNAQLWWDTTLENTYLSDQVSPRMWEYAE